MKIIDDRAVEDDFPEIVGDYVELDGVTNKCVVTFLVGDIGKEVDDESRKKSSKPDSPSKRGSPSQNDNDDDEGGDDGAPPSICVSITRVNDTSRPEEFAIVASESEANDVVNLDVRTSYGAFERENMGIYHGWLSSRI